jgi:hypothetical protein
MTKYELKPEYQGVKVTRNHMLIGKVTFDANTVSPEHYHNYVKLGFEELFNEIIETVIDAAVHLIVEKVEDIVENIQDKRKAKRKL